MKYLVLGAWSTRVAGLVLALWNQNAWKIKPRGRMWNMFCIMNVQALLVCFFQMDTSGIGRGDGI